MKDEKLVALLVTPVLPLPGSSGRSLRAWDWLISLSKKYRVHVLVTERHLDCDQIKPDYPAEKVWGKESIRVVTPPNRKYGKHFPLLAFFTRRFIDDWVNISPSQPFSDELSLFLSKAQVEHIVIFRLYMHELGLLLSRRFPKAILELDIDDWESRTRASVAQSQLRIGDVQKAKRSKLLASNYSVVERYLKAPYQKAYLASPLDCNDFKTRLARDIGCRPNRVPFPESVQSPPDGQLNLMFVGTLGYSPNEEAALFLVSKVLPLLRQQLALSWRLRIVGRHPSKRLIDVLREEEDVDLVISPDDLTDWYAQTHIVLVPMISGGGTKLKTLEAMAQCRPVISTNHGVRGLAFENGEHYLLAESASEFVEAIEKLVNDRECADRIARAGWEKCKALYST